jgi:hypothetical protein
MRALSWAWFFLVATLASAPAYAAVAVVTDVTGNVEVQVGVGPGFAIGAGTLLDPGAAITTGEKSTAVIRFEDGQVVALAERSNFRIVSYQFRARQPERGSLFVNLIEGGLRFVSGLIGRRNPSGVRVQVGTVTMGIRGTDFSSVEQAGDAVTTVHEGQISISLPSGQVLAVPAGVGASTRKDGTYEIATFAEIRGRLAQTPQGRRAAAQLNALQALTPRIDEAIKSPPPSQVKPSAKPRPPAGEAPAEPAPPPAEVPPVTEPTPTAPTTTTTPTGGTSGAGGGGGGTTASPN